MQTSNGRHTHLGLRCKYAPSSQRNKAEPQNRIFAVQWPSLVGQGTTCGNTVRRKGVQANTPAYSRGSGSACKEGGRGKEERRISATVMVSSGNSSPQNRLKKHPLFATRSVGNARGAKKAHKKQKGDDNNTRIFTNRPQTYFSWPKVG